MEGYNSNYHNVLINLIGTVLIGVALSLTSHSYLRLKILKTNGHDIPLLNIANICSLVNEFVIIGVNYANEGLIGISSRPWLSFLSNFTYFIGKPAMLYLAYLRAAYVYKKYEKHEWLHLSVCICRGISLVVMMIVDLMLYRSQCNDIGNSERCYLLKTLRKVDTAFTPIWKCYYIVAEVIFFSSLARMLKGINKRHEMKIVRYTRFQAFLFFTDIVQLFALSIYRGLTIFQDEDLISVYLECFSFAFTVYNMSQLGVTIPRVFRGSPHDGEIVPDLQTSPSFFHFTSPPDSKDDKINRTTTEHFQLSDIRTCKLRQKLATLEDYASGSEYNDSIESPPKAVIKNRVSNNERFSLINFDIEY
ncbi:3406_t:CDS:2 [Ambispora leptoticha]|uniref:3406_t:CDS:1 n=1 Tax=Ambispora leptoticha TaxID=144679 RepID=A0A9N9F2X2_9GLOM|nr:3406_t:CDS:2 [Ambispora leptoticha]